MANSAGFEQEVERKFTDTIRVEVPAGLFGVAWKKRVYRNPHGRDAEGIYLDHFVTVRPKLENGKFGPVQPGTLEKLGTVTAPMELLMVDNSDLTEMTFDEAAALLKEVEAEDDVLHDMVFGVPEKKRGAGGDAGDGYGDGVVGEVPAASNPHYVRGNLTEAGRLAKEEKARKKAEKKAQKKAQKKAKRKQKEAEAGDGDGDDDGEGEEVRDLASPLPGHSISRGEDNNDASSVSTSSRPNTAALAPQALDPALAEERAANLARVQVHPVFTFFYLFFLPFILSDYLFTSSFLPRVNNNK